MAFHFVAHSPTPNPRLLFTGDSLPTARCGLPITLPPMLAITYNLTRLGMPAGIVTQLTITYVPASALR
jgi:hypothetical protein